jgi:hypothetical protein
MERHTRDQLQRMFEAFGLGTEADRLRYQRLTNPGGSGTAPDRQSYALHFDNATTPLCGATGAEDAELAPDSQRDPHDR